MSDEATGVRGVLKRIEKLDAYGNIDKRECGWMGCGHPKCELRCAVDLDEWLWWKHVEVPTAAYSRPSGHVGERPQSEANGLARD